MVGGVQSEQKSGVMKPRCEGIDWRLHFTHVFLENSKTQLLSILVRMKTQSDHHGFEFVNLNGFRDRDVHIVRFELHGVSCRRKVLLLKPAFNAVVFYLLETTRKLLKYRVDINHTVSKPLFQVLDYSLFICHCFSSWKIPLQSFLSDNIWSPMSVVLRLLCNH